MSMTNPPTTDEVNALQGRELDNAVAEWMGYKNIQSDCYTPSGKDTCGTHPLGVGGFDGHGRVVIPNYSENITAMLEVRDEIQKRGLTEPYIEALSQVVAPEYASIFNSAIELDRHGVDINGHEFMWRMAHATPEQRARAVVLMVQEIAAQDRLMHQMSDHAVGAVGGE